ncbi:MAG: deoxyribonuclease V [Geminicoccaceae bacterium]
MAREIQERLRHKVVTSGEPGPVHRIAGVDAHVSPATGLTWAAVAVVGFPALELAESALVAVPTGFPYVPGYLSFRETPAVLKALALLRAPPDLLMVDGHGIAHPRGLGIASHLGVLTGLPSIGVAKSRLVGRHEEPGPNKGDRTDLVHRGTTVATVLRSRERARPLFISTGHLISPERALELVLAMLTRYRLPEPTRLADRISRLHP